MAKLISSLGLLGLFALFLTTDYCPQFLVSYFNNFISQCLNVFAVKHVIEPGGSNQTEIITKLAKNRSNLAQQYIRFHELRRCAICNTWRLTGQHNTEPPMLSDHAKRYIALIERDYATLQATLHNIYGYPTELTSDPKSVGTFITQWSDRNKVLINRVETDSKKLIIRLFEEKG